MDENKRKRAGKLKENQSKCQALIAETLQVGDLVSFVGRGNSRMQGVIEKLKRVNVVVETHGGIKWRVRATSLTKLTNSEREVVEKKQVAAKQAKEFSIGDQVSFSFKKENLSGIIIKINRVNVSVQVGSKKFRIHPSFLHQ